MLACALLPACGGGGGGGAANDDPAPAVAPAGFQGVARVPDLPLGRLALQEPNDTRGQAYPLPPLSPRSSIEAVGELDADGLTYGRIDTSDACRIVSLTDQRITTTLTYAGLASAISVSVTDDQDEVLHEAFVSTSPHVFVFDVARDRPYVIQVDTSDRHASFVLRFEAADPSGGTPLRQRAAPTPAEKTPAVGARANREGHARQQAERDASITLGTRCATSHVLVRLEDEVDPAAFFEDRALVPLGRTAAGTWRAGFSCPPALDPEMHAEWLCERLTGAPGVQFAEPDWRVAPLLVPDDPDYPRQWHLHATGCEGAWEITTGDADVVIGVVDSGIVSGHPDFVGRLVPGYDFISSPAVSRDGDGRDPDPEDRGDAAYASGLSSWHGTHVAGVICSNLGDGVGGVGVAPGCRVMPLRTLGVGGGLLSDVADAILFGAALHTTADGRRLPEPLAIMNLSLGIDTDSFELRDACQRAANRGVLLVAAAGNSGGSVLYPAAYDSVMAVGAVDLDASGLTWFSTPYSAAGPEIEVCACGGLSTLDANADGWIDGIYAPVLDDTVWPAVPAHRYLTGTSQAAPQVAGAAALLLSLDPDLSSQDIRTRLCASALDLGVAGRDDAHGWGLLQVHEALRQVKAALGDPIDSAPALQLSMRSVRFIGFQNEARVPVYNAGGGTLSVLSTPAATDDGTPWLSATLVSRRRAPLSVNTDGILISVNRADLPDGRYSGTVRVNTNAPGTINTIRVVMYVGEFPRAGADFQIVALEDQTNIARAVTKATADLGYRYYLISLPESDYVIRGGEDLDGDGFFCADPAERCGYFGGATRDDAAIVAFSNVGPPKTDLDVELVDQGP